MDDLWKKKKNFELMVQFQTIWKLFSASFGVIIDPLMKQDHHTMRSFCGFIDIKREFRQDTNPACRLQKYEIKATARPNNFKIEKRTAQSNVNHLEERLHRKKKKNVSV